MPCLSDNFNLRTGPLLSVGVAAANSLAAGVTTHNEPFIFRALIDTGAALTCLAPSVAATVGLQPIGLRAMTSATHAVPVNVYLVDLAIAFGNSNHIISCLQVMEFNPHHSPFQMLLGRDVLCRGVFTMSFDGHYTLSL